MWPLRRSVPLALTFRASASGAAIIASVLALPVSAQGPEKVDLRGVVVNRSTAEPIAGAHVQVYNRSAITNAQGRFQIRGMSAGEHALVASYLGYTTYVAVAKVEAGQEPLRIELEPNPVLLEAIQVVVDRMKARRNALPFSVRAFEEKDMAFATTAYDFLRSRLMIGRCPSESYFMADCVWRRGVWISPDIYIDEVPYRFAGLDVLDTYPTSQLHTIEVLNSGMQIRVYTKWFTDRLAKGRAQLSPIVIF
jgi:hypothetical protein